MVLPEEHLEQDVLPGTHNVALLSFSVSYLNFVVQLSGIFRLGGIRTLPGGMR